MKKFLAILLSAALCATVAFSVASAVDTDTTDDTTTTVADKSVADYVADLKNDPKAQELADSIADSLANGSTSSDVKDLLNKLNDYVEGAGFEVSDLQDSGAVRDVMDKFLSDAGVDSEELNKAISESSIANGILGLYYTVPEETTEPTTEPPTEEVTIPDTGYMG